LVAEDTSQSSRGLSVAHRDRLSTPYQPLETDRRHQDAGVNPEANEDSQSSPVESNQSEVGRSVGRGLSVIVALHWIGPELSS
jgi:hypothetical protein